MAFEDFYRNRRVLVTGHTGFKGSWLCLWLKELRASVTGYALAPDAVPNLFSMAAVASDMESVIGDVRDFNALRRAFDACRPEVVFHLAAQPLVRRSYREPRETFDVNVQGTVNVLEAVRLTPSVKVAAVVTSDKCYENREWPWGYRENDPLGGRDPYSASKGAAELVVAAYRRSFFADSAERVVGVVSLRAGNVIGGGDFAEDRILPDALRAAESDLPLVVRSPRAHRPWQHVLEPLSGYLALAARAYAEPERYAGAWNFGPRFSENVTVGALVDRFYARLGRGARDRESAATNDGLHEAHQLSLCVEKARALLGWCALYTVDEAVAGAADWYRSVCLENGDARHHSVKNIGEYVELARAAKAWWG